MTFAITSPELPGAEFASVGALREFVHERLAYNAVVAAFAKDRDECALAVDLGVLCYDQAEIAWHAAHPGQCDRVRFI